MTDAQLAARDRAERAEMRRPPQDRTYGPSVLAVIALLLAAAVVEAIVRGGW